MTVEDADKGRRRCDYVTDAALIRAALGIADPFALTPAAYYAHLARVGHVHRQLNGPPLTPAEALQLEESLRP